MGETLEQWAPLAKLMRSDDWRDAERCAAGELDYFEPHDDWCVDQDGARLVLAYRDKVAAGLTKAQRSLMANLKVWGAPSARTGNALERRGIGGVEWAGRNHRVFRLTDFGCEVARVLQEGRDR